MVQPGIFIKNNNNTSIISKITYKIHTNKPILLIINFTYFKTNFYINRILIIIK
jgi:hypothetical protein